MSSQPLIETQNLVKKFGTFIALNGVSLKVFPGEVHALLGDNGAGKSTLIKALSGVHQPTSGTILVEGKETKFNSPRDASEVGIGTVYQDLALNALTSVTRNFFLGREIKFGKGPFGILKMKEMHDIAINEMAKIGIKIEDPEQPVGTMSGGQRQTLAIARAIYFGAKVLILDEPTSALDVSVQSQILNLLMELKNELGLTYLLISHNLAVVEHLADRVAVMYFGEIVENEDTEQLFNKPSHDYTKKLLNSVLVPDPSRFIRDT